MRVALRPEPMEGKALYRAPRPVMRPFRMRVRKPRSRTKEALGPDKYRIQRAYQAEAKLRESAAKFATPNYWRGKTIRDYYWSIQSAENKIRIGEILREWGMGFGAYYD